MYHQAVVRCMLLATAVSLVDFESTQAQAVETNANVTVEKSLRCFVISRRAGAHKSDCEPGVAYVEAIIVQPREYRDVYSEVLDGLQDLVLRSEHFRVRAAALNWLATAGTVGTTSGPVRGIVDRLAAVYRELDHPYLRGQVAERMVRQQDRTAAVELLTEIARDNRPQDRTAEWPPAYHAVLVLKDMGPEGKAVLRTLHAQNEVRNAFARRYLEHLAEHGFENVQSPIRRL